MVEVKITFKSSRRYCFQLKGFLGPFIPAGLPPESETVNETSLMNVIHLNLKPAYVPLLR